VEKRRKAGVAELGAVVGDDLMKLHLLLVVLALVLLLVRVMFRVTPADEAYLHVAAGGGREERSTTVTAAERARRRAEEELKGRVVMIAGAGPLLGAGGVV